MSRLRRTFKDYEAAAGRDDLDRPMFNVTRCAPVLLLIAGVAAGCNSPDTQGRFDSFVGSTVDDRRIPDMGMVQGGQQVDFSGQYFFSLKTPLNTGDPFYFLADVTVDDAFAVQAHLPSGK